MNGGLDPDPTRNCRICNEKVFVCQKDAMGGPYIANNGICNGCLAPGDIEMAKETTKEFVKRIRNNIISGVNECKRFEDLKKDLDDACDRLEEQQRMVADFITKAEEILN